MCKTISCVLTVALCLCSCASSTNVSLLCNEEHMDLYVDGQYVGRGLVQVTVPRGKESIKVSCVEEGVEVYSRSFYVKGKDGQLFELTVPKDYRYSSQPTIIRSR